MTTANKINVVTHNLKIHKTSVYFYIDLKNNNNTPKSCLVSKFKYK